MFGDCGATHVDSYACVEATAAHHPADLLGAVYQNAGGKFTAKVDRSAAVRLCADSTAAPAAMPPARPRVEIQ